jgi:Domain of unknown function (DUF4070)
VPVISLSVLVAPAATPLYARMQREGRVVSHGRFGGGSFLKTNIRPKLMSEQELESGAAWLLTQIYSPEQYGRRLRAFAEASPSRPAYAGPAGFNRMELALARRLAQYGGGELALVRLIESLISKRPDLRAQLTYVLLFYCQVRFMMDVYRL